METSLISLKKAGWYSQPRSDINQPEKFPLMGIGSRRRAVCPVPQNDPCMNAGMNVLNSPCGVAVHYSTGRPKATEVSPWYGVCTIGNSCNISTGWHKA